jgi:hypothetical protein
VLVTKQRGSGQYRFRRDPLFVGAPTYIAPNNIKINCSVLWIGGDQPIQYEDTVVTLKDQDIYPWRAEAYAIGTKMVDGEGKTLAEIIDRKITPTLVYTNDQWGNLYAKPSSIKVDTEIRVRLKTTRSQGELLFLFQPLRIGLSLGIYFSTVSLVNPIIVHIE